MEQTQTQVYLRKGLIALIAVAVIVTGIVVFPPRKKTTLPELSQYLPASTVFALRVDRASVMGQSHHLIETSEAMKGWQTNASGYWQAIEGITSLPMQTMLMAVTEDRGILWQSVFFTTEATISDAEVSRLAGVPFDEASWYVPSTDALHFQRISDHVGAILSVQDTQDYTSASSDSMHLLTADPVALYAKQDIGLQIADMVGAQQTMPGLGSFIRSQPDFRAGFSFAEPLIRLSLSDTTTSTAMIPALQVPSKFNLAFAGSLQKVFKNTKPQTFPVSAALQSFINTQASAFSFKPEDLQKELEQAQAILIAGDQWLMVEDESTKIADIASLFIGVTIPKRMISTLPDGSPYREIVRGMPTPQIEDLGGFKVSVWSAVSPNATSTIANLGSSALYTVEKDGKWYISTSKDLISLQFEKRPDSLLGAQPLIKSCASPLIDLRQEIEEMWILSSSPANSSSEQTATIASISQKTQEKKDIHILCVQ